jgi:membrane-bound lytic murein transglycosylase B
MKKSIFLVILSLIPIVVFTKLTPSDVRKIERFKPVIEELLQKGVDTNFVYDIVTDERTKFNDKYCRINVLGFLGKADYSKHYNERSVKKTKEFHKKYNNLLDSAENRFGVPSEVIASVLWVETRHGAYH